jgi:hypothetical protein
MQYLCSSSPLLKLKSIARVFGSTPLYIKNEPRDSSKETGD